MNYAAGPTYFEGRTLLRQLQGLAQSAGASFKAADVVEISGRYPEFRLRTEKSYRTSDESEYHCKTLIFATGTARKHPLVDGKWRLWLPVADIGNAAFYCPDCEAPLCKDKDVLVVNAGSVGSALHVANAVSRFTKKVRILMTEDAFVPYAEQDLSKLQASPFQWTHGKIKSVEFPRPGRVQWLTLATGERIKAEVFFVAHVARARSELAQSIGIQVDERGSVTTDHRGKTNIDGIWAAGDVRPITQQVATAVGTGNYAALMIDQFLGNDYEIEQAFDHPESRGLLHLD